MHPLREVDPDAALRGILAGTSSQTGAPFFEALVESLARVLQTQGAWVTELLPGGCRLRALAFYLDGCWNNDYEFDITGTPCEAVIQRSSLVHFPDRLIELYPNDPDIRQSGTVSYLGIPLTETDGSILGHMAVVDRRPMPEEPRLMALFRIFADRAAAELRRWRAEQQIRQREQQLRRLFDGAMDAIVELDESGQIALVSAAAERTFGTACATLAGRSLDALLGTHSARRVQELIAELDRRPEGQRHLWIAGTLEGHRHDGSRFQAEGTLSRFEIGTACRHILILRDVNQRLEAERRIESLTEQAAYLREELQAAGQFSEIVGRSPALAAALAAARQVAPTDSTALILGETGTGKELFARAIHQQSRRAEKPLVKVNCAAVPASLMESEFFGHQRGAFTGATSKRLGRFALADGGTLFLDEVGELPLELQAKLLRVLQEGEFEPVGSSQSQRVDVRVLAATNCDLEEAMRAGKFREDLYYRLNVFPLRVPPLRERDDDVLLLADVFAERFARRMHRRFAPFSTDDRRRLRAYTWPGNVRELQNVVERAVITAHDGHLNLAAMLPDVQAAAKAGAMSAAGDEPIASDHIYTQAELDQLERDNLLRALEATGWKVAGPQGAAARLGIRPSTLNSRIKALGIRRPA